jgi:hypothetical protein
MFAFDIEEASQVFRLCPKEHPVVPCASFWLLPDGVVDEDGPVGQEVGERRKAGRRGVEDLAESEAPTPRHPDFSRLNPEGLSVLVGEVFLKFREFPDGD